MGTNKRRPLGQMMRAWLGSNRHGKLAADQWLNLITKPLEIFIFVSVPLVMIFALTPARVLLRYASYTRWVIPVFLIAMVVMLVLRARHYARLPLFVDQFYLREQMHPVVNRFRRSITLHTDVDEVVTFNSFVMPPPYLEVDTPYLVYYLEDNDNLVMLSYGPMEHPDIDLWRPTAKFSERQMKRNKKQKH